MRLITRRLLQFAVATFAASSTPSAQAQEPGYYVSAFGGASFARDADLMVSVPGPFSITGEMQFDTGWLAGIAAGRSWNWAAIEGEFSFTENGLDRETLTGIGTLGLDGQMRTYAFMVNGYFRLSSQSHFTPYVGVGIGGALIDVEALADGNVDWFRANDVQFAYQGIAGVSYAIGAKNSVGIEYRYFGTSTPSFTDDPSGGGAVTSQLEHQNQNLLLRLTHTFP